LDAPNNPKNYGFKRDESRKPYIANVMFNILANSHDCGCLQETPILNYIIRRLTEPSSALTFEA